MALCTEGLCITIECTQGYDDDITPMEKFAGTTTFKNCHTWGFLFYVLDAIF